MQGTLRFESIIRPLDVVCFCERHPWQRKYCPVHNPLDLAVAVKDRPMGEADQELFDEQLDQIGSLELDVKDAQEARGEAVKEGEETRKRNRVLVDAIEDAITTLESHSDQRILKPILEKLQKALEA